MESNNKKTKGEKMTEQPIIKNGIPTYSQKTYKDVAGKIKLTKKNGIYIWTGPKKEYGDAVKLIYEHRHGVTGKPIVNMHENPMCIDLVYLTTDPEQWKQARVKYRRTD